MQDHVSQADWSRLQLRSVLSYEKAKQQISWSPTTSFEEGLKETVDFFHEQ